MYTKVHYLNLEINQRAEQRDSDASNKTWGSAGKVLIVFFVHSTSIYRGKTVEVVPNSMLIWDDKSYTRLSYIAKIAVI